MDSFGQPNFWQSSTLGELGRWYSGGTPDTSNPEYWNGDIPWITSSSMYDFNITNSERKVTELGVKNGTRVVPANTILIVVRGMSLKKEFRVGITRREVAFGQDCKAIIPNENVDPLFLAYVLQFKAGEVVGLADESSHGTGRLQTSLIQALEIPLPPLAEQRKIAAILGTWDAAIASVEQLIAALQARKQGLMQRLLTGAVRFPEFAGGEWREVALSQCLRYTPRKIEKPSSAYTRMGLRSHGKGTFTEVIDDPSTNAMDHLYIVKANDLIVNITFAWEQAIAIVNPEDEGALVSHRFPTYVFNPSKTIHEFFRYLMLTKEFLYQLDLITPGGAGRNRVMSKTDFLRIRVKIPQLAEQKKIGGALSSVDKTIHKYDAYLSSLKEQKQALMQQLLTGQVRVKVGEVA